MTQDQHYIDPYVEAFRGRFSSVMRWEQLDGFWEALNNQIDDKWYIYAIGEEAPEEPCTVERMTTFIKEINVLLRKEHDEDYCAIVYADDLQAPQFVKIFDPHNLGVSCGFSENPPLPGWVLSKMKPINIETALKPANNRRRWCQKIFD